MSKITSLARTKILNALRKLRKLLYLSSNSVRRREKQTTRSCQQITVFLLMATILLVLTSLFSVRVFFVPQGPCCQGYQGQQALDPRTNVLPVASLAITEPTVPMTATTDMVVDMVVLKNNKSALDNMLFVLEAVSELVNSRRVLEVPFKPLVVNPLTVSLTDLGRKG